MPTEPEAGDADVARIAGLIGDRTRARVLMALMDGRALPASRLAAEAGVAASTVSEHLAQLVDGGLLRVEPQGRNRFFRLASPEVAAVFEAIARISPPEPVRSLRQGTRAYAVRRARTCYDHLAGRLGVEIMAALLGRGLLDGGDGRFHGERPGDDRLSAPGRDVHYALTADGHQAFGALGVDLASVAGKRPQIRYCLDWSEQRHHLAGPLGTALADRLFALRWVERGGPRRVVLLTDAGRQGLVEAFGVSLDWYAPAGH